MKTSKTAKAAKVTLDRSRLLGFDQASRSPSAGTKIARGARLASLGARVGGKPGGKPVSKSSKPALA